jgi:hypothetical protein
MLVAEEQVVISATLLVAVEAVVVVLVLQVQMLQELLEPQTLVEAAVVLQEHLLMQVAVQVVQE